MGTGHNPDCHNLDKSRHTHNITNLKQPNRNLTLNFIWEFYIYTGFNVYIKQTRDKQCDIKVAYIH